MSGVRSRVPTPPTAMGAEATARKVRGNRRGSDDRADAPRHDEQDHDDGDDEAQHELAHGYLLAAVTRMVPARALQLRLAVVRTTDDNIAIWPAQSHDANTGPNTMTRP